MTQHLCYSIKIIQILFFIVFMEWNANNVLKLKNAFYIIQFNF